MDNCDSYCYLGVVLSRSGSLRMASKALHDKALGAMFSIIRNINRHYACRFDILLDIFDKMVLPIALYNSEVWGTNFLPVNIKNNNLFDVNALSKHIVENMHLKFLKMILGINQSTSNWAVLSETGRFPIIIRVLKSIVKYVFHLNKSPSNLLIAALTTNINLSRMGFNSWFKYLERTLTFCNLEYLLYSNDAREINFQIGKLNKTLKTLYVDKWKQDKSKLENSNSKLDLFLGIKESFGQSTYLMNCKVPLHRIACTKIRLSAHKFPIETGRYEQTPREERKCPFCEHLGDEQHYILNCSHPFISEIRLPLINQLVTLHQELGQMNDPEILKFLLKSASAQTIDLVGALCYKIQNTYLDITG